MCGYDNKTLVKLMCFNTKAPHTAKYTSEMLFGEYLLIYIHLFIIDHTKFLFSQHFSKQSFKSFFLQFPNRILPCLLSINSDVVHATLSPKAHAHITCKYSTCAWTWCPEVIVDKCSQNYKSALCVLVCVHACVRAYKDNTVLLARWLTLSPFNPGRPSGPESPFKP